MPANPALAPGLDSGLGLPPGVWLLLTVLTCLALFFKFQRFWSIRNLDLLLLFTLAPGLVLLASHREEHAWWPFVWLFLGTAVWLLRCLLDLGLTRRPLLEPNLNVGGLSFFFTGLLSLVLIEVVIVPERSGAERNPGDPHAISRAQDSANNPGPAAGSGRLVGPVVEHAFRNAPTLYLRRAAAALGHLGVCLGLVFIGWRHYERPIIGLAMAVSYLILPYTRIALVDSGQLVPAALLVLAVLQYRQPVSAGSLIGLAAAWMPAAIGLIPLWAGFYWNRGASRFLAPAVVILGTGRLFALAVPEFGSLARRLGARTLAEAGLLPSSEDPGAESFWISVDPAYRLPVLVLYLALVLTAAFWPAGKNLGQLIALSAALLLGSQFWYLDEGGTLIVLYLPMILLLVFRPNLAAKFPEPRTRNPARRVRGAGMANRDPAPAVPTSPRPA